MADTRFEGVGAGHGPATMRLLRVGIVAGLFTCIAYPLLNFAPVPDLAVVALAGFLGPALGIASVGLREALRLHRPSVAASLGCWLNLLAGALLSAMLLVQLAVRMSAKGEDLPGRLIAVWLGLDVTWDVYIGLGTTFFAIAMMRLPRFGLTFAVPGLLVALALLAVNLVTFPVPPAEAGLFDVGPLVGFWYLAVTVQIWRSLSWAARLCETNAGGEPAVRG